jgi:ADP-ribose pyrophosphatase
MKVNRSYRKPSIPDHAKCVFEGVLFDIYQWEQKLYDGSTTIFEKATRADTVVVFPILGDGRVMFIDDEQPGRAVMRGAPAGRVDPGETPEEAARRELREETGMTCTKLVLYNEVQPVLKLDWVVYTYIAYGCTVVGEPEPDPGEKISLAPVTFDEMVHTTYDERNLDGTVFRMRVLEAELDPKKMEELKKLFAPQ